MGAFDEMLEAKFRKVEHEIADRVIEAKFRVSPARRAEMVADVMGLVDEGWPLTRAFDQIVLFGRPGAPMREKTGLAGILSNGATAAPLTVEKFDAARRHCEEQKLHPLVEIVSPAEFEWRRTHPPEEWLDFWSR